MSSYSNGLAGVFMAAGIAVAAAEEPVLQMGNIPAVSVTTLEGLQFRNFKLEETVLSDNSTLRGRAYVDDVLGITCEWVEKGRSRADAEGRFHIVDRKPEAIGCVRSTELPRIWDMGEQDGAFISQMVIQPQDRRNIIAEYIESEDSDTSLIIKREWNITAQEVCLRTMEYEGEYKQPFNHAWGCFPIRDMDYFGKVMDLAGLRPV